LIKKFTPFTIVSFHFIKKNTNYGAMQSPINVALLSYGMSGEVFHAPLLSSLPQFKLATVVQRSANTVSAHYPQVRVVKTVQEVLDDDKIELVIINTPNATHYEFTEMALLAGKHVIVEKPFTVTSREADSLITLAGKQKRMLSVFQNRRWDGDFLTVRDIVERKVLGKIVEFEAHYDRFRNYIEPNTWKEEKRSGTGILYNLGSHMLDQVLVLFGMPDYVDARIGIQRPGGRVDDFYDIRLEYNSHLAIVKSSYLVKEEMPRYILHGTEGSFVKYGIDPQEQELKEKKNVQREGWGTEHAETWGKLNTVSAGIQFIETIPGNYLAYYKNIHEVIRKGAELLVKPTEASECIRLIELCYESNSQKKAVKV
jgi:scyllo-inositol 2-dehydrogenase (NADP+)